MFIDTQVIVVKIIWGGGGGSVHSLLLHSMQIKGGELERCDYYQIWGGDVGSTPRIFLYF